MANDTLKTFLIERLVDLDPTLNDSEGSLMYVKVIDPLMARLGTDPLRVDIETFLISRLEDEYPQLDIRSPGSVIKDILINPLALLLEPLQREIEFLRVQNSLADATSLTEVEMDALLSNVLSERQFGDYSRGTVRVYFNTARSVGVDSSIVFSTADGTSFVPSESFTYSPDQMIRSGGKYYLDIPVESKVPEASSNISSGEIRFSNGLDGVSRVANLAAFTGGVSRETNEDFLVRAERSLSERSLNTKRGIETEILNSFDDIVSVDVVGSGEPEMLRDVVQARVRQEFDEDIGPLIYMTGNWKTHPLLPTAGTRLPFTNTIKIMPPAGGAGSGSDGGWPAELRAALLDAKYIRVADGSGLTWSHDGGLAPDWGDSSGNAEQGDVFRGNTYKDTLLNRVRAVDTTYYNDGNDYAIYMKLRDFDIYPKPLSITDDIPNVGTLDTSAAEMGLNRRSAQGSIFKMIGEKDGDDIVLGAHLPFTDYVHTNFTAQEIPAAVVPGRDFLVCYTDNESITQDSSLTALGITYPKKLQLWPLTRFYSNTELGVGRIDSFLVSKDRTLFPGKSEYVYDPNLVFSMMRERVKIYDYGAPFFTDDDPSKKFGGQETEEIGRNPGCMIQVMETSPSVLPNTSSWATMTHPAEVDLILHSTQLKWADRNVAEGQYVSCSVYNPTAFDGKVASVENDLQWQGWGRIKKVGAGTPWRLRVEGMDFGPLHERNFGGFTPPADALVTLTGVPQIPTLAPTQTNDDIIQIRIVNTTVDVGLDVQWDGAGVKAEKTFNVNLSHLTPVGGNYSGGELSVLVPLASLTPITADDASNSYASLSDWAAGLQAKFDLITNITNPGWNLTMTNDVVGTVASFTITSDLYGEYGNTVVVGSGNGYQFFCVQNSVGIDTANNLAGGVAPTLENLTKHLNTVINSGYTAQQSEIMGLPSEGVLRIYSTQPGPLGNDTGYYVRHEDPSVAEFLHGTWNVGVSTFGSPAGVLHGGFNYGFGPLEQVGVDSSSSLGASPGANPNVPGMDLAAGDLVLHGHEVPTFVPEVDGFEKSFVLTLGNSPIERGKLRLHYWDISSAPGQWVVWQDNGVGALTQVYPAGDTRLTGSEVEYSQGAISLTFSATYIPKVSNTALPVLARQTSAFSVGYNYYQNPFKAHWAVYRGAVDTISSAGDLSVSYDDFAYLPAYKRPGPDGVASVTGGSGAVEAPGSCFYRGDVWDGDEGGDLGTGYCYSQTAGHANERSALWLRLGKGFEKDHPSIGGSPSGKCLSAEVIDMTTPGEGVDGTVWPSGDFNESDQIEYSQKRYTVTGTENLGAGSKEFVATRTSLPAISGAMKLDNPSNTDDLSFDLDDMSFINFKGLQGFLLPHPMGPAHYGGLEFPYTTNNISLKHLLDHQILQVYEQAPDSNKDTSIVISGIPGGVPFPGYFGGGFEIASDEIHLGGMTDVYIKATAVEEETTGAIKLQPESLDPDSSPALAPTDPAPVYEVLVQAADGSIDSVVDETHFDSIELLSAITSHYDPIPGTQIALDGLVIEILDPQTEDLQPIFFRAIHTTPTGVKVDGEFPSASSYTDVRFRALLGCTTSVTNPLVVLQQGNDLIVKKNELSVFCPSGFEFGTSPLDVSMFVSIDSDASNGEYSVTGKNLNTLIIDSAIPESGSGLSYRVYTKQTTGVVLPLVRMKTVSLSGDEAEGIVVPYKNPIDIVASAFAGMNDDPINQESIGEDSVGTWEPTVYVASDANGDPKAHLVVHDQEDFVTEHNIIKYDVVRIDTLDEPNKYFYVEGFTEVLTSSGSATGNKNALILDRPIENLLSNVENVKFTIGRPAVGTAELVFKDPTYIEIGPDSVFSYEKTLSTVGQSKLGDQRTYKFRPSPLESAVLYRTSYTSTDLFIDHTANGVIVSEDENFFKHGFKVGDRLTILTRVIRSTVFNGVSPYLEDENLSLAGKTLAIDVDGTRRSVVFSGPNPTTLEQAVSDINRQVGDVLKADIYEDPDNDEKYYLQISSDKPIQLVNEGTVGILDELNCPTLGEQDNNYYSSGVSELFDPYTITAINYVASAGSVKAKWKLTVASVSEGLPTPVTGSGEYIFAEVRRYKYQRLYPSDMTQNDIGLYTATVTLTSYDPNVPEALITDKTQLGIEGHTSLGYEMVVKNTNYAYSLGEECSIRTTSVILDDTSSDLDKVYALPGAEVTLTYERSQPVSDVQSLLLGNELRVVCNNPLSKHFFPAYLFAGIDYGDSGYSASEVKVFLEDHFKTLYPNKPLEIYDVTSVLARKGVGYVRFPQTLAFLVHDENRVMRMIRDENIIYLNKRFHIMEDTSGITINKVR